MALTKSDVEHIAHLARLDVSDDEIADYVDKLSSIIDLVASLASWIRPMLCRWPIRSTWSSACGRTR